MEAPLLLPVIACVPPPLRHLLRFMSVVVAHDVCVAERSRLPVLCLLDMSVSFCKRACMPVCQDCMLLNQIGTAGQAVEKIWDLQSVQILVLS